MGLVTTFCPLTTTGAGETVFQSGDIRFVVECKVKLVALVGHVNTTSGPEGFKVSGGGRGNLMLNTVPCPDMPPYVVP